jgi:hypothetical protein
LENLAANGELAQTPEYYDTKFKVMVSLEPGTATWNTVDSVTEWQWDCSPYLASLGICVEKGHWDTHDVCTAHGPVPVSRSIETVKFFLIPSAETANWYGYTSNVYSPTVLYAYPDFWMPVTAEGDADRWLEKGGLHFYYSMPLRGSPFYLPSKLPQTPISLEVINPIDANVIQGTQDTQGTQGVDMAIPVCDANTGNDLEHRFSSISTMNYGYSKPWWEKSMVGNDSYNCTYSANAGNNNTVQSIELDISQYDFDIPGTFYLGVVTQILPAKSPKGDGSTEKEGSPHMFQPSNIHPTVHEDIGLYSDLGFSVWMIVSTPCWNGNLGTEGSGINDCVLLKNP